MAFLPVFHAMVEAGHCVFRDIPAGVNFKKTKEITERQK